MKTKKIKIPKKLDINDLIKVEENPKNNKRVVELKKQVKEKIPIVEDKKEEFLEKKDEKNNVPKKSLEYSLIGSEKEDNKNLEESLQKVKKEKEEPYTHFNEISQEDNPKQNYKSQKTATEDTNLPEFTRQRDSNFLHNPFVSSLEDPWTKREIDKYSSKDPDDVYNTQNLREITPGKISRKRISNPFIQDIDPVKKYD